MEYAYPRFSEILRKHYGSHGNHFSKTWRSLPPSYFLLKQPNFENVPKGPRLKLLFTPPILISSPHLLCWFFFCNVTEPYGLRNDTCFLSIMSQNFMDYATIPFFFLLPKCYGTSRIVQRCLLLISGMSRNFTDCLTMGVKFLEAVKRRLHAIKQWSPDEIKVWQ